MGSNILKNLRSYLLMTGGLFVFVFSWTAFLIPHQIAGGGVSGLASVVQYATGFKVAYTYIIINAILLLVGFLIMGKAFGFKTIYCIVVAALMFEFLPLIPWVSDIEDKLINALIGGTMSGIGIGAIFMQGGSTGGTDIIALIIAKYRETSPGRVFLYADLLIIGSVLFIPGKELSDVAYGYIEMVSFSFVIDLILTGNRQSVQVMVFSSNYDKIADRVNSEIERGVTALSSMGWYYKQESKVLVIVLKKSQLPLITKIIKESDRKAFLTVTTVTSVYGEGFDTIKTGKIKWRQKQKES